MPDAYCTHLNNPYSHIPWWRQDSWTTVCHLFWYIGYCMTTEADCAD